MHAEIAKVVFPVFREAIKIVEGLRGNRKDLDFETEHTRLMGLLQAPVPDPLRGEYEGDLRGYAHTTSGDSVDRPRISPNTFLGIKYALACWLDEIFIFHTSWRELWSNNIMEFALYGSRLRAHVFWDQAKRAQSRRTRDAIEVYYLCAMLGFRGDMADNPAELNAWRDQVESRIIEDNRAYDPPPGVALGPEVPVLTGAQQKDKYVALVTLMILMYIPLLVVLIYIHVLS